MEWSALLCIILASTAVALAQNSNITFTNKTATFTNLEGRVFKEVELVRGDLDGLIWRSEASGGRVCYTNLDPDVLESFGISSNRIAVALARAQHKAVADAQYRAAWAAEAKKNAQERAQDQAKAAAELPGKQLKAQQAADLAAIQALQDRVSALDTELRHAQAMAIEDQKRGGNSYIKDTAVEQLNDLHEQLDRMAEQYEQRYGSKPAGVKTGIKWDYTR